MAAVDQTLSAPGYSEEFALYPGQTLTWACDAANLGFARLTLQVSRDNRGVWRPHTSLGRAAPGGLQAEGYAANTAQAIHYYRWSLEAEGGAPLEGEVEVTLTKQSREVATYRDPATTAPLVTYWDDKIVAHVPIESPPVPLPSGAVTDAAVAADADIARTKLAAHGVTAVTAADAVSTGDYSADAAAIVTLLNEVKTKLNELIGAA